MDKKTLDTISKELKARDRMSIKGLSFKKSQPLIKEMNALKKSLASKLDAQYFINIRLNGGRPFSNVTIQHIEIEIFNGELIDNSDFGGGVYAKRDSFNVYPEGFLSKSKKYKKIKINENNRLGIDDKTIKEALADIDLSVFAIKR